MKLLGGIILKTIESDRLILRSWKEEDYLDLHEFISDPRVEHSAGCPVIKDIEVSKEIIKIYTLYNQCYAIVLKGENKVIGSIGMDNVTPDNSLKNLNQRYLGYTINPNYWGKGYAPEAFNMLLIYLFEEKNIDLIWSSHYDFNIKSKRVIEKAGLNYKFSRKKSLKALDGKIVEEAFYNLFKEEYILKGKNYRG